VSIGPPFSVSETRSGDERRLLVEGELDMSTAPELLARIEALEGLDAAVLAVDLRGVTFMDVAGMRVLLAAAQRARGSGRRFVIRNPTRIAQRVFALTAIDQQLEIAFDDN